MRVLTIIAQNATADTTYATDAQRAAGADDAADTADAKRRLANGHERTSVWITRERRCAFAKEAKNGRQQFQRSTDGSGR